MALDPAGLKSKIKERIYNGLKKEFGSSAGTADAYTSVADAQWQKVAEALSGIAMDIIDEITTNGQVAPGIPTAGGPTSQVTVAPGKII